VAEILRARTGRARVLEKPDPAAPPFQNTMDLRLAYMEIGETEKGTAALRVGRQELVFGDQRLIGHLNWVNTGAQLRCGAGHASL